MNWSAPTDASWVAGSLRCSSPGEILMLLKSSDIIASDLSSAFRLCEDADVAPAVVPVIALRKWSFVEPSREFRCFVSEGRVVGMSQRNANTHFPHLIQDREALQALLCAFLADVVTPTFPRPRYCVDLYVTAKRRVFIIDFNVFAKATDPILCDWAEMEAHAEQGSADNALRIVSTPARIVPSAQMFHGLPKDLLDTQASGGGTTAADLIAAMMKAETGGRERASSSDSD